MNRLIPMLLLALTLPPLYSRELTWEICVALAKKNNPQLAAAKSALEEARTGFLTALSGVLPDISASGGMSRSYANANDVFASFTNDTESVSIGGKLLLFDGLVSYQQIWKSQADVEAALQNYHITEASIRNQLKLAYIGVQKAAELVGLTESIMQGRRQQIDEVDLRFQSGTDHRGSFLSAKADYAQAVFEFEQARRLLTQKQYDLARQIGIEDNDIPRTVGTLSVRAGTNEYPDMKVLAVKSPSYRLSLARETAAAKTLAAAYGSFAPSISLSASTGISGVQWGQGKGNATVGVNCSLPIFDGGRTIAALQSATAAVDQAAANRTNAYSTALQDLRQKWNDLLDAFGSAEVSRASLEAQEERAKIADLQYQTGIMTFDAWTIIQNGLVNAKKSYLNAKAQILVSEAAWEQSKGVGLDEYKEQ